MTLYLDNAATTHICDEVLAEMKKSLDNYGNTEAKYYCFAENAKKDVALARQRIAQAVGCESDEVVFTSGATEANNLMLKGIASANPQKKKIIISSIEHSSIKETCDYLASLGYIVVEVPVDRTGLIDLEFLNKEIDSDTLIVSIILVNNEIGTIQDIKAIDDICKKHKVLLHMDATQAIGKVAIDMSQYNSFKFLTFTAHKIYGPKGIGCLIIRKTDGYKTKVIPLFHGGEQEEGYRAGTLSNELIVGFGKACELATIDIESDNRKLKELENVLVQKLQSKFGQYIKINNEFDNRIPGIINVQFVGQNNMILLQQMSPLVAASTGSACSVSKPSRVLKAIGLSDKEVSASIRFSLSKYQRIEDLNVLDLL